jgi:hypothetical protein
MSTLSNRFARPSEKRGLFAFYGMTDHLKPLVKRVAARVAIIPGVRVAHHDFKLV